MERGTQLASPESPFCVLPACRLLPAPCHPTSFFLKRWEFNPSPGTLNIELFSSHPTHSRQIRIKCKRRTTHPNNQNKEKKNTEEAVETSSLPSCDEPRAPPEISSHFPEYAGCNTALSDLADPHGKNPLNTQVSSVTPLSQQSRGYVSAMTRGGRPMWDSRKSTSQRIF